jgi:predicted amidophosphoribosyltransferase
MQRLPLRRDVCILVLHTAGARRGTYVPERSRGIRLHGNLVLGRSRDDVLTTGATLNELASAASTWATQVTGWVAARTLGPGS